MTTTFLVSGTSYSTPADWTTTNSVDCIAGGASGAGGGGAWSQSLGLTLSGSIAYAIGAGGPAGGYTNGGDTTFNSSAIVAKGGISGVTTGAGGLASGGTGTNKFSGGNGANVSTAPGGGAAGPNANGGNGDGLAGGVGGQGDGSFGGAGGAAGGGAGGIGTEYDASHGSGGGGGGNVGTGGNAGNYGGGGGDGSVVAGAGAQGLIVIVYTPLSPTIVGSFTEQSREMPNIRRAPTMVAY